MSRSYKRMLDVATPSAAPLNTGDARDLAYHFFQDAFHLKDWLSNDPETAKLNGELHRLFKSNLALGAAADIANGVKHLHLTRSSYITGVKAGHAELASE
ncbi:hypothetical protein QR64_03020 [Rhodococcus sp. Chr-9]|nr:hypothetical protein QR64_03020 [Rhodococcus sp. Chr-9]